MTRPVETSAELGERVREARVAHGLSQSELAARMNLDRSAIVRIEGGERRLTALELLRLSLELDVPVAHFVHRPPTAIAARRSALDDEPTQAERQRFQLDVLLEEHLRDAEALRGWGYLAPRAGVPAGAAGSEDEVRELARAARRFIGLERGPLPALAGVAGELGLHVRVVDVDAEGASVTPEPGFGVSVVGGRAEPGRRRFTAAHEIGHHLLGDEYQSDAGVSASRDQRERLVDAFATELLLPVAELSSTWQSTQGDNWGRLVRLAASYRVSWTTAIRVALAADALRPDEVGSLQAKRPQLGDFLKEVGAPPEADLTVGTTGPEWRRAVVRAFSEGRISKARAVEMLHGLLTADELPEVPEPAP